MITQNDSVVIDYWCRKRRKWAEAATTAFAPAANGMQLEDLIRHRRGVLGRGRSAFTHALTFVACDLTDIGREHARWSKRLATTALEIGDFGNYPDSSANEKWGIYQNYESLYYSEWLLDEHDHDLHLQAGLKSLLELLENNKEFNRVRNEADNEIDCWYLVVPLLIGGHFVPAIELFAAIYGRRNIDADLKASSADFVACLSVLLRYLSDSTIDRDDVERVFGRFHSNLSRWGHEGGLWEQHEILDHVKFAQLRAKFFTEEQDAVAIVQSIHGISHLRQKANLNAH